MGSVGRGGVCPVRRVDGGFVGVLAPMNWGFLGIFAMVLGLAVIAGAMHTHGITPLDLGVAGMAGFFLGILVLAVRDK